MLFTAFGLCVGGVSLVMFALIYFVRDEARTKAGQAEQLTEQSFFAVAGDWLLSYIFPIGFLVVAVISLRLAWESFRGIKPSRDGDAGLQLDQ